MRSRKDDWERPRSKGTHLTDAEVQIIRDGFAAKRSPRDVARDLKCASRTVYAHYSVLSGKERKFYPKRKNPPRHRALPAPAPRPALGASRFYKSEFVPS